MKTPGAYFFFCLTLGIDGQVSWIDCNDAEDDLSDPGLPPYLNHNTELDGRMFACQKSETAASRHCSCIGTGGMRKRPGETVINGVVNVALDPTMILWNKCLDLHGQLRSNESASPGWRIEHRNNNSEQCVRMLINLCSFHVTSVLDPIDVRHDDSSATRASSAVHTEYAIHSFIQQEINEHT